MHARAHTRSLPSLFLLFYKRIATNYTTPANKPKGLEVSILEILAPTGLLLHCLQLLQYGARLEVHQQPDK